MTQLGPENLLRAIFKDKHTPICTTITQEDGTALSLQAALTKALDTLPLTKGKNDSRRWPRWKTVLDKSYGLNGPRLRPREIGALWSISPPYVSTINLEALRELRRNERVVQMLSAFFVQLQAQEAPSE